MDDLGLRAFERPDFDRLLAWIDSPESLKLWAGPFFRFPLDAAQLEAYRASAEPPSSPRRIYTAYGSNGERVGHIELNDIDGHSARLSRVLVDPARRGQGFGRAMVRPILRLAFAEWGLHRVDLLVFDFNRAAIRCYQAEGFVHEGHLRDARRVGNAVWSLEVMSILEGEWRARQGKNASATGDLQR
jgi:RimJ/RimL family protein N-acetyltransferase